MIFDPEDQRLTAFALGELEEADRLAVEALLVDSPEARRFVDEVRESADLLTRVLKNEPSPGLSIVQRLDLDATLLGRTSKPARNPLFRVLLPAVAGLLLALGGYTVGMFSIARNRPAASVALNDQAGPTMTVTERGALERESLTQMGAEMGVAEGYADSFVMSEPASPIEEATADLAGGNEGGPGFPMALPSTPAIDSPIIAFRGRDAEASDRLDEESLEPAESATLASRGQGVSPPAAPSPTVARPSTAPGRSAMGQEEKPSLPLPKAEKSFGDSDQMVLRKAQRSGGNAPEDAQVPASRAAAPSPPAPVGAADPNSQMLSMQIDAPPLMGLGAEAMVRDPESGVIRQAKVEPGNVVEVVGGPEGNLEQRLALASPILGLNFTQDGSQLLATTADKGVSVFDLSTGQLVNSIRVDLGPVPVARFGAPGELVLSNLGGRRAEVAPGASWIIPQREPVAVIPTNPGRLSLADLAATLADNPWPIAPDLPVLALMNGVDYPYERPVDGEPIAVGLAAVPTPWNEQTRLVRIALVARALGPDDDASPPPVVAEQVSAEIEFNPAMVAAYRPIGLEGGLGASPEPMLGTLSAGQSLTIVYEVEPVGSVPGREGQERRYRYRELGNSEMVTVSVSWSEPGKEDPSAAISHLTDSVLPMAEASDDLRFGAAVAWFGMLARKAEAIDPEAIDTLAGLVQSCDDEFLPDDQRELLGLIDRLRQGPPQLAAPEP